MTEGITWAEPPASARFAGQKPGAYKEFADALRQNPQKWAILPGERKSNESAKGTAQNIRRGVVKGFTKGEFETAVDDTKIYVRFISIQQPAEDSAVEGVDEDDNDDPDDPGPDSRRVRAWAKANGFDLPERGRMPAEVHEAYRKAHAVYQQG